MKITKGFEKKRHVCAAARCKDASRWEAVGICWDLDDGVWVPLCDRHKEAADKEFSLHEVEGSVRPLAETLPGTERAPATSTAPTESSANLMVPVELHEELEREKEEAAEVLEHARSLVITTQEDLAFVAEVLGEVKSQAKRIDERQKKITKPLNEALASIRELFKPILSFYGAAERDLKARISEAHDRQQANNAQALAEAQQAASPGGIAAALAKVQHVSNVAGVSLREKWAFEIVDPSAVPRELCEVSPKLIREYVKTCGENGPQEVPGIRFYKESVVAARASGAA